MECTLKQDFDNYLNEYRKAIEKNRNDMYIHDLVFGGINADKVENMKRKPIKLFYKGVFNLHKWHSNIASHKSTSNSSEETFAKQMFSSSSY